MELSRGTWVGVMPGANQLSAELGVNHKTAEAALCQLEREGVLAGQGAGRRRRVVPPTELQPRTSLRIAILLLDPADRKGEIHGELRYHLHKAGHVVFYPRKSVSELGGSLRRLSRMVKQSDADAWVVVAGSREVLAWFEAQGLPVFALAGRYQGLPVPSIGPNKLPAMRRAMRKLVKLGHRRIVLLCRTVRRVPVPGVFEREFLQELESHGITPSSFNLPEWREDAAGLHATLEGLFRVTPPTAVFLDEAVFVASFLQFCARRRLGVPTDVSLLCNDPDPSFSWFQDSVAHIGVDHRPIVRRIERWARNVSHGRRDLRQSLTEAKLISGGTIGPVPACPHQRD